MQAFNQIEDATGGGLIQVACGLVGQEQAGIVDEGAGQCNTLLLATG